MDIRQSYKTKDDQYRAYQYASRVVIGTKPFMKAFEQQVEDAAHKLGQDKGHLPKQ